ncbi:TAXI family TRAP transporter solute-binding subunit [Halorientalis pallida]|uniref:TAXI family TRAP transporter solute-binding subunit n=1 Tax=Halorientalis pallida TaxID=2479928 RepID=UPI003C6EB1BB
MKRSLGTAGLVGAAGLAGCFGDDGSGSGEAPGADGEMVMTTSTQDTAAYTMSTVIANVVNQNNDTVSVQAQPSEGTNANIGRLSQDQSDIAYIQNWTASKIANGEKPFKNLDFTPVQTFHLYDLAWFMCSANDGWTSVEDIGQGDRISPTPSGSGTAEMLEYALSFATEDYERISIGYGEQGSAMSEGRLDAGAGTFVNLAVEPSWLQQMKSTVDLRLLQFPSNVVSELEQDPSIIMSEVDTTQFEGYGYAPDTLNTPALAYNFVTRDDFDYDTLYTFLETLWANRDGLGEQNALLGRMEEGEFWIENGYTTLPFHPAAADFYKEQGIWNDEYTVAEQ